MAADERIPVEPGDLFIGFSWTHTPSYKFDSPTVETWIPVRRDGSSRFALLRTKHPGSWLGQRTFLQLAYRILADEQRHWFGGSETIFGSFLITTLGGQCFFPKSPVPPLYIAVIAIGLVVAATLIWQAFTTPKRRPVVLQTMA